jgi:HNH endonuclease
MTSATKCIFCDSDLTPDTKPEHILLDALGGRKKTREAICSGCNNTFGGTIDAVLANQVQHLRNLLQFGSGTGRPPPQLKNVETGSEILNFNKDGRPHMVAPPFTVTELPDGQFDVQVNVSSPEELRRVLPHLAAKLRMSEDEVLRQLKLGRMAEVEMRPQGRAHHPISFGGPDALRSISKSCLVLLSTATGTAVLKLEPFAAVREFVLRGGKAFSDARTQIDSRDVPGLDEFERRFGHFFNLIYVRSNDAGRVIGHFTMYNTISWQIVLAEEGGPPNQQVALVSNPADPATWSDDAASLPDIPFEWLDTGDRSYELARASERLSRMMEHHIDTSRDAEFERIAEDVFKRHGIEAITSDTDPALRKAVEHEIAARAAAHAAGVPYARKLTPEDMDKMVKGK